MPFSYINTKLLTVLIGDKDKSQQLLRSFNKLILLSIAMFFCSALCYFSIDSHTLRISYLPAFIALSITPFLFSFMYAIYFFKSILIGGAFIFTALNANLHPSAYRLQYYFEGELTPSDFLILNLIKKIPVTNIMRHKCFNKVTYLQQIFGIFAFNEFRTFSQKELISLKNNFSENILHYFDMENSDYFYDAIETTIKGYKVSNLIANINRF